MIRATLSRATAVLSHSTGRDYLRREISGCSGDDFLRWQEIAAEGTKSETSAGNTGNAVISSAVPKLPTRAPPTTSQCGPASRVPQDVLAVSESLARNMIRSTARWQAAHGTRRHFSGTGDASDAGPKAFDVGTGDRNLGGWRQDPGEVPPELLRAEQEWRLMAESTYRAGVSGVAGAEGGAEVLRKKLRYSCSKRGWVEMEVLLSRFMQETGELGDFNLVQLQELERVLLFDDLFLMALVTGRKPVPPEFHTFYALQRLVALSQQHLATSTTPKR